MCSFADLLDRSSTIKCNPKSAVNLWKQFIVSIADKVTDETLLRLMVYGLGDGAQHGPCELLNKMKHDKQWKAIDKYAKTPPMRFYARFLKLYVLKPNKVVKLTEVPKVLPFKVKRNEHFIEVELITEDLVAMLDKARPNSLTPIHEALNDTWFHIGIHNVTVIINGENQNVK